MDLTCFRCFCSLGHFTRSSIFPSSSFSGMGRLHGLWYLVVVMSVAGRTERRQHKVQHGPCSYTFILPEMEQCPQAGNFRISNSLQRDSPSPPDKAQASQETPESSWQVKKLENLQSTTENNTQWLQKVSLLLCMLKLAVTLFWRLAAYLQVINNDINWGLTVLALQS